jgi:hypothetical protein
LFHPMIPYSGSYKTYAWIKNPIALTFSNISREKIVYVSKPSGRNGSEWY